MKYWMFAAVGLLPIAAVFATPWLLAQLGRRYGTNDVPIQKPRYLYLNADEDLATRTAKKRQAADGIRARAAQVESGAPVSDILRRVR